MVRARHYRLTVFLFLRLLGFIYFIAFLSLSQQLRPLIGADGLYPARLYLEQLRGGVGDTWNAFLALPSLFWIDSSDAFMQVAAYAGVGLAGVVLCGMANVPLLAALWFLYMSFVHIGQLFYGYGWEILLLETGFLALFIVPVVDPRPFAASAPPATVVMWLMRWLLFRVMFGAGLIKLRGDECWRDLTCMMFHYETQPLPNPLSWYMHHFPAGVHRAEVVFNHFVELVVPWFLFVRWLAPVAGLFLVAFQVLLILSGNLSWLNWLTLTLCVACFDDAWLRHVVPRRRAPSVSPPLGGGDGIMRAVVLGALVLLVGYLSINPVMNMLSPRQAMNTSFDRLHLVNTYGAFGSIGRERDEIILEGTDAEEISDTTQWRAYEFNCKPGDVWRRPCVIAPYHYRLDWQIWFAAMSDYGRNPWLVHFVYKLLDNDRGALGLLGGNPFPDRPPRFIRAERYRYRFTQSGDASGAWWTRSHVGEYLPPLERNNPQLRAYLRQHGWGR
jgi:hypothetical protein